MSVPSAIAFSLSSSSVDVESLVEPTIELDELSSPTLRSVSDGSFRKYMLTIFQEDGAPEITHDALMELNPSGYSAQWELCPETGRPHMHVFVYSKYSKKFSAIKSWGLKYGAPSISINAMDRQSRVNALKAARYCCKQKTRIKGTEPLIYGNFEPKVTMEHAIKHGIKKSKDSDSVSSKRKREEDFSDEVIAIAKGLALHELTFDDLAKACEAVGGGLAMWAEKHSDTIKRFVVYEQAIRPIPDRQNEGIVARIGCAGTGKSYDTLKYISSKAGEHNLDGVPLPGLMHVYAFGEKFQDYRAQPFIHLAEFGGRNSMPLEYFKLLANVGYKGSEQYGQFLRKNKPTVFFNHSEVCLDSNLPLTSMYPNCFEDNEEHWKAFIRRFKQVIYYPACKLQEGSLDPFDYLIVDGRYVSNKFDATENPNPSKIDILDSIKDLSYEDAQAFFRKIDSSSLVHKKQKSIDKYVDYSFARLKSKTRFIGNKPLFVVQKEVSFMAEFNDPVAEEVIVRSFLRHHTPPDFWYDAASRKWTVAVQHEPEGATVPMDIDQAPLERIRGGGPSDTGPKEEPKLVRMSTDEVIVDLIGPTSVWPRAIAHMFNNKCYHLRHKDRFTVVVFFLCNGVNPELIREWFAMRPQAFTSKDLQQIDYIVKKYPESNWTAWNVAMGKSM
jgi:hypothetical protein